MKVKDLKKLLRDIPEGMTRQEFDDLDVLIPVGEEFDGHFIQPCLEETGFAEMAIHEDEDDLTPVFVIVRCGFFAERHGVDPELN